MSARPFARLRLAVALATTAAAIAACDSSTAPTPAVRRVQLSASIEGDTLQCRNGWIVLQGRYECLPY